MFEYVEFVSFLTIVAFAAAAKLAPLPRFTISLKRFALCCAHFVSFIICVIHNCEILNLKFLNTADRCC